MKTSKILGGLGLLLVLLLILSFSYLEFVLPRVPEAKELKIEPTPERLARGEHLVNDVMACLDCHSTRDFKKFAPGSIPGTEGAGGEKWSPEIGFPGQLYSPNITPYSLSDWTDGEIYRALTCGVDREGNALFPIMPYHEYALMDDEDLYAVIAYIRTLPSIPSETPERELDFPLNMLVNTMPRESKTKLPPPDPTNQVEYGRYLFTASACSHCHTRQEKGQPVMEEFLAGGFEFHLPNGILVRSSNLTPDKKTGIGDWTVDDFVETFHSYRNMPEGEVNQGEFNTIMPWRVYAGMTREELSAIYTYLRTVPPVHKPVERYQVASAETAP